MNSDKTAASVGLSNPISSERESIVDGTGLLSSTAALESESGTVPVNLNEDGPRSTRPVFVVGCPRSGTTLLQHMILSAGDFALYPSESDTFAYLGAKFPRLSSLKDRRALLDFFLRTKRFAELGLERSYIESRILTDCSNIGEFLRIVMEAMCRKQGMHRWVEKTPDHALYISEIKRTIPESLIIHIIRDGRDVSLSLAKYGVRRFFWEGTSELLPFSVLWKWMVQKTRARGRTIGRDYYEIRYEDLVEKPRETLAKVGDFIQHDLDYDRILRVGFGSVSRPYTSFPSHGSTHEFNPVGRWKNRYTASDLARLEALVGDCLEELGYPLATPPHERRRTISTAAFEAFYTSQLEAKLWIKSRTPLGRFVVRSRYEM